MPMDRGSRRSQASNEKQEPKKKKKKSSVKLLQYVNTPWPTEKFLFFIFLKNNSIYLLKK